MPGPSGGQAIRSSHQAGPSDYRAGVSPSSSVACFLEREMSVPEIHRDGFVRCVTTFQHALGDGVLQFLLDGALERACTIQRVEAHLGQFVECGLADFQLEVCLLYTSDAADE